MNRSLVALFLLVEAADLATYLQAPHLEANVLMAALPVAAVVVAKVAGVALALAIASRIRTPSRQALALGLGVAVGAFGFGANTAVLSIVNAAETPRPAAQPAPIAPVATGFEQGAELAPEAGPRTAASPSAAPRSTPALVVAERPTPGPRQRARSMPAPSVREQGPGPVRTGGAPDPDPLRGVASWYAADGLVAAAGPALRRALGPQWRGTWVRVCAGRCVVVKVTDWCQCYRGTGRERVIDLSDGAFARISALSRGLARVSVAPLGRIAPPETDR